MGRGHLSSAARRRAECRARVRRVPRAGVLRSGRIDVTRPHRDCAASPAPCSRTLGAHRASTARLKPPCGLSDLTARRAYGVRGPCDRGDWMGGVVEVSDVAGADY